MTALPAPSTSSTCVFGKALGRREIPAISSIDGKTTSLHVLPWRSALDFTLLDAVANTDVQLYHSRAYNTIEGVRGFVTFCLNMNL
jgi:hypothetical protein